MISLETKKKFRVKYRKYLPLLKPFVKLIKDVQDQKRKISTLESLIQVLKK